MREELNISAVINQLHRFKQKYYFSRLIKGLLFSIALILGVFVLISFTEYNLRLNSPIRLSLLIIFLIVCVSILIKLIAVPLYKLLIKRRQLNDFDAAKIIGKYYDEIDDKLLNVIQLSNNYKDNSLAFASINQNADRLQKYSFSDSVSIKNDSIKVLPYFLIAIAVLFVIIFLKPNLITEGSYRVLKYNENFIPAAPFSFELLNKDLKAYKGDNIQVRLNISGGSIPQKVFIDKSGSRYLMEKSSEGLYTFNINQIQQGSTIYFEGGGYRSKEFHILVSERPLIKTMLIEAVYPKYLKVSDQKYFNATNLKIPEGTYLKWTLNTQSANDVTINIENDSTQKILLNGNSNLYSFEKQALTDFQYYFTISNKDLQTENSVKQNIKVIPDNYPDISLTPILDSTYYSSIIIEGNIQDDYGFSRLRLFYSTEDEKKNNYHFIEIPINKESSSQNYFFNWPIDSLFKQDRELVNYYTQVWDNDGVNGEKSSKSTVYQLRLPNQKEIKENIGKTSDLTENQIVNSVSEAKELKKNLEKLDKLLKTKQNLNFEDKQLIKDILKQNEALNKKLQEIEEKLTESAEKREKFTNPDKALKEKNEELLERVKEMQSEEEQELLDKIKALLNETDKSEELMESSSELNKKEKNKLKELERLMQLFQRLELEYDLSEIKNELTELSKEQEKLATDSTNGELQNIEEQEMLNESFEEIKKSLSEIKENNQKLDQPAAIKDTKSIENEVDQAQQESLENLKNQENRKAKDSQKKSSDKMKEMSSAIQQMQEGMQGEQIQEDIDNLRDIVDNLLKLSFRQETIMKSLRGINASDPKFLSLSEQQLNLKDDAKIIEDSLNAVAKRVFQIETIITEEISNLNDGIEQTIASLKVREDNKAVAFQQQTMESTNNLSLLLDDIIQQMQMQMQSQGGQKSSNQQQPSPSEMQKSLNQKTQELSEGQKSGRELSEGIGEIAAEQARIRKLAEEMMKNSENGGKRGDNGMPAIIEEMNNIEEELVNKRLNSSLIKRQKKLVTKLLEAEKAQNEQEEDNERQAESAITTYDRKQPKAIEDYIKSRQSEIEKLNSTPPSFSPYYKEAVDNYYQRIKENKRIKK